MKPLEERREFFRNRLRAYCDMNDPDCIKYPVWLRKDFWNYWTAMNDNGRKMYFEMESKWNTGLRLATFVKNSMKDPRWKKPKSKVYKPIQRKEGQMAGFEELYKKDNFNLNK